MTKHFLIDHILAKYALYQPLTPEEQETFAAWRAESEENERFARKFSDPEWVADHRRELHQAPITAIWADIQQRIGPNPEKAGAKLVEMPVRPRVAARWWTGVAVLGFLCCFGWLLFHSSSPPPVAVGVLKPKLNESRYLLDPRYRFHLTLPNGRRLYLDTVRLHSIVASGERWRLTKTDTDAVAYTLALSTAPDLLKRNKAFDPGLEPLPIEQLPRQLASVGGQLPDHRLLVAQGRLRVKYLDGSAIWIDRNSSLAYSPDLSGTLHLDGQAYFDIIHDTSRALAILTPKSNTVRLLGTRLNVRSYSHENQETVSLYTDSASIAAGGDRVVVRQQYEASLVEGVRPRVSSLQGPVGRPAWVNEADSRGFFEFNNTPLAVVLQTLTTGYGVRIENPDGVIGVAITGKLASNQSLEQYVLAIGQIEAGYAVLRLSGSVLYVLRRPK